MGVCMFPVVPFYRGTDIGLKAKLTLMVSITAGFVMKPTVMCQYHYRFCRKTDSDVPNITYFLACMHAAFMSLVMKTI